MKNRLKIMASLAIFGLIFVLIQALYLFFFSPLVSPSKIGNDLDNYPCARDCTRYQKPITCSYDFTAEWYYSMSKGCFDCPYNTSDCHRHHCITGNGNQRPVLAINRQIPGPGIQVCQGDRIKVTVHNRMDNAEGISIHWHGLHQRQSPYMDGTTMITQCPIPNPQSFTYDFAAETAGTHWWHAHSGLQRADGLYGPLIVRQASGAGGDVHGDLYDVDDVDHVLMISDWTNVMAIQHMMMDLHADGPGQPDSLLINGRSTQKVFEKNGKKFGFQYEVFTVTPGLRYRFRTIGAVVTNCPVVISIDKHKLLAIASDGVPFQPLSVDGITIAAGERYDFVLHADKPTDNYWIRFTGAAGSECEGLQERAILRYTGAPTEHPARDLMTDLEQKGVVLNEPLISERSPGKPGVENLKDTGKIDPDILRTKPDVTHYIEVDSVYRNSPKLHHALYYPVEKGSSNTYTAKRTHMFNNISFAFPSAPLLSHSQQIPDGEFCLRGSRAGQEDRDCGKEHCSCVHTIEIALGQVVELVLVAKSMKEFEPHPLHLHGNHFHVMACDNGEQISLDEFKELDRRGAIYRNFDDPPRKDTFMMAKRYAVVRFKADNPGWWLFHCHMDLHFELGMAVVFRIGRDEDLISMPENMPVCAKDARQKMCNSHHDDPQERHVPPPDRQCPEVKVVPSSSNAESTLIYMCIPSVIFVSLACMCFINTIRKFAPRREDKYKYRRLSNGEMGAPLIEEH